MTVGSQLKQTLACLQSAQATLRQYAAQSQDQGTVSVYTEVLQVTEDIVKDLAERVKVLEFQEPQYKGL